MAQCRGIYNVAFTTRSNESTCSRCEVVARAPSDGYTLLIAYGSHLINPTLYAKPEKAQGLSVGAFAPGPGSGLSRPPSCSAESNSSNESYR